MIEIKCTAGEKETFMDAILFDAIARDRLICGMTDKCLGNDSCGECIGARIRWEIVQPPGIMEESE